MDKTKMRIVFGANAPALVEQLAGVLPVPELVHFDKLSDAVTLLFIHGYLTDSQTIRSRQRLCKRIVQLQDQHLAAKNKRARKPKLRLVQGGSSGL